MILWVAFVCSFFSDESICLYFSIIILFIAIMQCQSLSQKFENMFKHQYFTKISALFNTRSFVRHRSMSASSYKQQIVSHKGMVSLHFIKMSFQMLILWNTIFFLPVVLILSYFSLPRAILLKIYKYSGLTQTLQSWKQYIKQRIAPRGLLNWLIGNRRHRFEYGYAVLKQNGKYLDKIDRNVFAFQLYDYLARKFLYMQSLTNKSVLEVECGSRHGIEYVARNLNAARCVAVSSDRKLVNRLKQENTSPKVVYKHSSIQDLPREADLGKFDCILAINALGMDQVGTKLINLRGMLGNYGYLCIAECLQNHQIQSFQRLLLNTGFIITKSQNLTKNVLHTIKLQTKKLQEACFLQRWYNRIISIFNNPVPGIVADLEERCKFLAYIVEVRMD